MSSLMTCSSQGVVVQGRKNEKECVVEDIRNRSSHVLENDGPLKKIEYNFLFIL